MDVILKYYNFCDFACVFFEVCDKFSRPDLPNSNLTFFASRYDKLIVVAQGNSCNTVFMSVINLP